MQNQIVDRKPISAILTYTLAPEGKPPETNGNPDTTRQLHPVLRSPDVLSTHAQVLVFVCQCHHHFLSFGMYGLQAQFRDNCGNDNRCIPDLQITSASVNVSGRYADAKYRSLWMLSYVDVIRDDTVIVIGQVKTIDVIVSVRNVKENAYNPRLIATFPGDVRFAAIFQSQVGVLSQ